MSERVGQDTTRDERATEVVLLVIEPVGDDARITAAKVAEGYTMKSDKDGSRVTIRVEANDE